MTTFDFMVIRREMLRYLQVRLIFSSDVHRTKPSEYQFFFKMKSKTLKAGSLLITTVLEVLETRPQERSDIMMQMET